jgi:hypothetical protein
MLDVVVKIVPTWQRGMIARPGRQGLVQVVMAARPIHHLLVMDAPMWLFEDMEKDSETFSRQIRREPMAGSVVLCGSRSASQRSLVG